MSVTKPISLIERLPPGRARNRYQRLLGASGEVLVVTVSGLNANWPTNPLLKRKNGFVILYANMKTGLPMLRQIREARGYSLRALADEVGMSYVALYRIESGQTDPRLSTLRKLAKVLKVTVGDLIGERKPAPKGARRR